MADHSCPRCSSPLTQYCHGGNYSHCLKCKVKWRCHNNIYCMECEHPQVPHITIVDSVLDGLDGWVDCNNCHALVHEQLGTAKHIRIVEYIQ